MECTQTLEKEQPAMTIELITFTALALFATIATVVVVVRDGYRRVPTRRF